MKWYDYEQDHGRIRDSVGVEQAWVRNEECVEPKRRFRFG